MTAPRRDEGRLGVVLRPMTVRDLSAVRRIERAAYTDAWSRRVFDQELRNAFAHYFVAQQRPASDERGTPGVVRRVLRRGRAAPIVGFAGVWYMGDQLHIATIAVAPRHQGRGLGARLLLECFAQAGAAEMQTIALEVRVSNQRARNLYERYTFRVAGRLAGYYQDDGEDALVMVTPVLEGGVLRQVESLRDRHRERYPDLWLAAEGDVPAPGAPD